MSCDTSGLSTCALIGSNIRRVKKQILRCNREVVPKGQGLYYRSNHLSKKAKALKVHRTKKMSVLGVFNLEDFSGDVNEIICR